MENPTKWILKNRLLLSKYRCKYVAISNRIIASGERLAEVDKIAKKQSKDYVIYYVPKSINRVRILPIHVKSISVHEWQPLFQIEIVSLQNEVFKEEALIDSGADISCLPYQVGMDLGFQKYPQEVPLKACGIGGEIDYFQREIKIIIDGHKMDIPVAWIQDKGELELIIGRAVVFDSFDITFRQTDEEIEFHFRQLQE